MKLLSICIPSYNVDQYLDKCLSSLVLPSVLMNSLEIIIINDGSKDTTLEIANGFKNRFPNSVIVIDKPNGHYGSCINAALSIATGKYFKILDADDWYSTDSLELVLNKLADIDADVVYTKFSIHIEGSDIVKEQVGLSIPFDTLIDLNSFIIPRECQEMHGIMYSTHFLKSMGYHQTEGVCYTDTEYVFYPLIIAKTFTALDTSLYQYRVGLKDQSVSILSLSKNFSHFEKIYTRREVGLLKPSYLSNTFKLRILSFLFEIGLLFSYSKSKDSVLRQHITELKTSDQGLYNSLISQKVHSIPYIRIWDKYSSLLSSLLLLPLRLLYRIKIGYYTSK